MRHPRRLAQHITVSEVEGTTNIEVGAGVATVEATVLGVADTGMGALRSPQTPFSTQLPHHPSQQ